MIVHVAMLYVVPPVLAAAPLRDTATTACERSRRMFCTGFQTGSQHTQNIKSTINIVAKAGYPKFEALNISLIFGRVERDMPAVGGTNVSEANKVWMTSTRVGGSESSRIRIEMASRSG